MDCLINIIANGVDPIEMLHLIWIFTVYQSIYFQFTKGYVVYGPQREKTCHRGFPNNTGADQPVHPSSLISTFVIRFMGSNICILATGEI